MARFMKVFMTFIGITAIAGYLFQVRHVSLNYFEYKVNIHWLIFGSIFLEMPRLHVCFDFIDILNREKISRELKINMKRPNDPDFDKVVYLNQLKKLSIKQLFQYTPDVDQILNTYGTACSVRYPNLFLVKDFPDAVCYMGSNITKYLHRNSVCYRIKLLVPKVLSDVYKQNTFPPLSIQEYCSTMDRTYLVYELVLNQKIASTLLTLESFVEMPGSSVLQNSMFSFIYPVEDSLGNNSSNRNLINMMVRPSQIHSIRLPAPYVTKCQNIPGYQTVAEWALHNVALVAVKELNEYTPLGIITNSSLEYKLIGQLDFANPTFITNFGLRVLSKVRPDVIECSLKLDITYGSVVTNKGKLSSSIVWPKETNFESIYVPVQELSEYIIFMFSCLGFWFGTSYLTIYSNLASVKNFYSNPVDEPKVEPVGIVNRGERISTALIRKIIKDNQLLVMAVNRIVNDAKNQSMQQEYLFRVIDGMQSQLQKHGSFISSLTNGAKLRAFQS